MFDFTATLNSLVTELNEFLKKYEAEASDIFDFKITDVIHQQFKNFNDNTSKLIQIFESQVKSSDKIFNSLYKDYSKKEATLDANLKKSIQDIKDKYSAQVKKLQDEINEKRSELRSEENNYLMDIDFFIMGNEQNNEMFEHEYEESMSRFDYHIQTAEESYANNTIQFNDQLEAELTTLEKNHSEVLIDYDADTKKIIERYQKKISDLNEILSEKMKEFEAIQFDSKEKKRLESIELNGKIRDLVDIKNRKIIDARQEYQSMQEQSAQDKEKKRQAYQAESQKISKEFVISMNQLDEKITDLRNQYNLNTDLEKRNLFYRLLELKKEQEKELYDAKELNDPKSFKKYSKRINRNYQKYGFIEEDNNKKTLDNLSKGFLISTAETNFEKKQLDINRSFSIMQILEQENRDNKHYQELNNSFENEMNLKIEIENLNFNKSANNLRLKNSIVSLYEEKEFDEVDASHQIETETLMYKIKTIRYEMQALEEIQKLVHNLEDNKYTTNINFRTVANTLEIEKCKVLDNLNHSLYRLNADSAKTVLEMSKRQTQLRNEEFTSANQAKIKRNYMVLDCEEKDVIYQIETFQKQETLEIQILNRNYFYELDSLGHTFLSKKFSLELKEIHQALSLMSQIIIELQTSGFSSVNAIFDNVILHPDYMKTVWSYLNSFMSIIYSGFKEFLNGFKEHLFGLINTRLEFEESLKYKGFYKNIESQFNEEMTVLVLKKKEILNLINEATQLYEDNKQLEYSLENELFQKKKKANPKDYHLALAKAREQKRALNQENLKHLRRSSSLNKELQKIESKISSLERSYSRQQEEIRKMQLTNAQSYYEMKKNYEKCAQSYFNDMHSKVGSGIFSESNYMEYEHIVRTRSYMFMNFNSVLIADLYKMVNEFHENEKIAIEKSNQIMTEGYITDLQEINIKAIQEMNEAKQVFSKEDNLRQEAIHRFDREQAETARRFKEEIKKNDEKLQSYTDVIQVQKEGITKTFYEDYYAISDNLHDIQSKLSNELIRMDKQYNDKRLFILQKYDTLNKKLKETLDEYITTRNDTIHHLPTAAKLQEKSLKEEVHKKNEEIDATIVQAKLKSTMEHRSINRNLLSIDAAFQNKNVEIDKEKRLVYNKERKNHQINLKRI